MTTGVSVVYEGGDTEVPTLVDPATDCSSLDIVNVNECLDDATAYDATVLEGDVAGSVSRQLCCIC